MESGKVSRADSIANASWFLLLTGIVTFSYHVYRYTNAESIAEKAVQSEIDKLEWKSKLKTLDPDFKLEMSPAERMEWEDRVSAGLCEVSLKFGGLGLLLIIFGLTMKRAPVLIATLSLCSMIVAAFAELLLSGGDSSIGERLVDMKVLLPAIGSGIMWGVRNDIK